MERRTAASLLVDAGNVTAGPRDWEVLELEHILMGYTMMGYDAVNAGHREAALSPETLRGLNAQYDLFVSANLLDKTGNLVLPPYRIVDLADGYRVGILGVVDDTASALDINDELEIAPPEDAIAKYLPELRAETDFILLLAFAGEEQMKALADRFFEVDLIVGGNVLQPSSKPVQANQSLIVYNTDQGKSVGRLVLAFDDGDARVKENEIFMLEDGLPHDADMDAIVDELKQKLAEMDLRPHRDDEEKLTTITAARSKTANTYVVSEQCEECHPQAYATWAASRHAFAFEPLVAEKQQYDPECLRCHTAGYAASDGYVNQRLTQHLAVVSCDSCHGRGNFHVKFHSGEDIPEKAAGLKMIDCVDCHDLGNSPAFDFDAYWEKMKHGIE